MRYVKLKLARSAAKNLFTLSPIHLFTLKIKVIRNRPILSKSCHSERVKRPKNLFKICSGILRFAQNDREFYKTVLSPELRENLVADRQKFRNSRVAAFFPFKILLTLYKKIYKILLWQLYT